MSNASLRAELTDCQALVSRSDFNFGRSQKSAHGADHICRIANGSRAILQTDRQPMMCNVARMDDQQSETRRLVTKMLELTGLDATNLARQAKVQPSTLTRFLNGDVKHTLSLRTLRKLTDFTGISFSDGGVFANAQLIPVVGYVGAFYQMFPFDDAPDGLEQVPAPPGASKDLVAVTVKGNSMVPAFHEGDLLFYKRDAGFDRDECLYQECVVKVLDGPIYVKVVRPGRDRSVFTLESFNAPPIFDVEIEWAAPVLHINRTRRRPKATMLALTKPARKRQKTPSKISSPE